MYGNTNFGSAGLLNEIFNQGQRLNPKPNPIMNYSMDSNDGIIKSCCELHDLKNNHKNGDCSYGRHTCCVSHQHRYGCTGNSSYFKKQGSDWVTVSSGSQNVHPCSSSGLLGNLGNTGGILGNLNNTGGLLGNYTYSREAELQREVNSLKEKLRSKDGKIDELQKDLNKAKEAEQKATSTHGEFLEKYYKQQNDLQLNVGKNYDLEQDNLALRHTIDKQQAEISRLRSLNEHPKPVQPVQEQVAKQSISNEAENRLGEQLARLTKNFEQLSQRLNAQSPQQAYDEKVQEFNQVNKNIGF